MFQCYQSLDCWGDARRCTKPECSEPPGTTAKPAMFIYSLIVLKNTISNRQCYVVRHVNERLWTKVFCLLTMLFVCRLACYQNLVWFKKKIKKQSCVLFYMYPPAPSVSLNWRKWNHSYFTKKRFFTKRAFFPFKLFHSKATMEKWTKNWVKVIIITKKKKNNWAVLKTFKKIMYKCTI